jgi:hypothetical protein
MVALRNGLMQCRLVVDVIPFEDGDRAEMISEYPRRHQSREATADDDRLFTEVMRHAFSSIDHIRESPSRTQA